MEAPSYGAFEEATSKPLSLGLVFSAEFNQELGLVAV